MNLKEKALDIGKQILRGTALGLILTVVAVLGFAGLNREEIRNTLTVNKIREATVKIMLYSGGSGTAVFVKSNDLGSYLVTNKHVCVHTKINSPDPTEVYEYDPLYIGYKGKNVRVYVTSIEQNTDLCIVHTPDLKNVAVIDDFADKFPANGTKIVTHGFPGTYESGQTFFGESRHVEMAELPYAVQMAHIHCEPGQSGSGAYDLSGNLIGLVHLTFSSPDGSWKFMTMGLVPISDVRTYLCRELDVACN